MSNYQTVLTDRYWWTAFVVTLVITVISVAIEFVLGMALALVMHRTIFGRGMVRTAMLIPYGIVTVAASYSWYYAWTPGTGYLANLLPDGSAPLTQQIPSLAIMILAEVWKTTPFMALLLLAGLALVPQDLLKPRRSTAQARGSGWSRSHCRLSNRQSWLRCCSARSTRSASSTTSTCSPAEPTTPIRCRSWATTTCSRPSTSGLGSAISVLIFLSVAVIAFIYITIFGASAPGADDEER